MDPWLAVVLLAGGVGVSLILSIFKRMAGHRDWGSAHNPGGSIGGWTPPELPEDEWEKWKNN